MVIRHRALDYVNEFVSCVILSQDQPHVQLHVPFVSGFAVECLLGLMSQADES